MNLGDLGDGGDSGLDGVDFILENEFGISGEWSRGESRYENSLRSHGGIGDDSIRPLND